MARRRIPSPAEKTEPLTEHFSLDFEAYMQRWEQQKALATEMIQRAREMCIRAKEMRKRSRLILP